MAEGNGNGNGRGPVWDNRITLGNLLTITTIVAGMAVSYANLQSRIAVLETQITHLKEDVAAVKKQVSALERLIFPTTPYQRGAMP